MYVLALSGIFLGVSNFKPAAAGPPPPPTILREKKTIFIEHPVSKGEVELFDQLCFNFSEHRHAN